MNPRPLMLLLLVAAGAVIGAVPAAAAWPTLGAGGLYAHASGLAAGNPPAATTTGRSVTVSWSATSGPVPVAGYLVQRYDNDDVGHPVGPTCAGTITAQTCTETGLPPGTWRYTITPTKAGWRGTESAPSTTVTVKAPTLTLQPQTVNALPATLTGTIEGFLEGQSLTLRLDDPDSGPTLTATVTPNPTPENGAATVELTIPAGTNDGTHSIYAIGSSGDIADTTIDVAAACVAPGDQILPASQDSYVDSLLAVVNNGTASSLSLGPSYLLLLAQQRALVKFELPEIPDRCTLTAATLRLYATSATSGRTIQAWQAASPWTETSVTWTNQPAPTGTPAASPSLNAPGWQTWNVLTQVEATYLNTNNGFIIKDSADTGVLPPHQTYQAREGTPDTQDPQLTLTFN